MDRRNNKVARAAHIKRNTEGTSNEISLSVLDAAKNRLDGGVDDSPSRLAAISLFTLRGKRKSVATPSKDEGLALSQREMSAPAKKGRARKRRASDEVPAAPLEKQSKHARRPTTSELVAARKARRRRSRVLAVLSIALALVAGVGAVTWWVYGSYTTEQQVKMQVRSAIDGFADVDKQLTAVDDVMTRLDDGDAMLLSADDVAKLASDLDKNGERYRSDLESAGDAAFAALSTAESSEHTRVLSETQEAVNAREQMLSDGAEITGELAAALEAKGKATSAWQQVLSADSLAREAASLVANATAENIASSSEKSQQAIEAFGKARAAFEEAAITYPKASFDDYLSYIDKRVEAQGYAVASNDALLAKDSETARAQNDAYNASDADAAALARSLPEDPISPILDVFESRSAKARESYADTRTRAAAADAFISDYLGASDK